MGDGSYFFRKGEEVFDLRCAFNDECVVLFMQNGRLDFNLTKQLRIYQQIIKQHSVELPAI